MQSIHLSQIHLTQSNVTLINVSEIDEVRLSGLTYLNSSGGYRVVDIRNTTKALLDLIVLSEITLSDDVISLRVVHQVDINGLSVTNAAGLGRCIVSLEMVPQAKFSRLSSHQTTSLNVIRLRNSTMVLQQSSFANGHNTHPDVDGLALTARDSWVNVANTTFINLTNATKGGAIHFDSRNGLMHFLKNVRF
jgi:hypothetical protein